MTYIYNIVVDDACTDTLVKLGILVTREHFKKQDLLYTNVVTDPCHFLKTVQGLFV